jgi:hypothetical protein
MRSKMNSVLALMAVASFASTVLAEGPCTSLNPHAAQLVGLLNRAARDMTTGGKPDPAPIGGEHPDFESDVHCPQFFRQFMRELLAAGAAVPGEEFAKFTSDTSNAEVLTRNLQSSALWKGGISASQAQILANSGVVVVGSAPGAPHYHLAVVQPIPPNINPANFEGSGGPFVRDGNEHYSDALGQFFPSSWGAVKASLVFSSSNPPTWYVFQPSVPSLWNRLSERSRQELAGSCDGQAASAPTEKDAAKPSDSCFYDVRVPCINKCNELPLVTQVLACVNACPSCAK